MRTALALLAVLALSPVTVEFVPDSAGLAQLAAGESGFRALPPLQIGETASVWFQLDYRRVVAAQDCLGPFLGDAFDATVSVRGSDATTVRELPLSIPLLDSAANNAERLFSVEWDFSGNAIGECTDSGTGSTDTTGFYREPRSGRSPQAAVRHVESGAGRSPAGSCDSGSARRSGMEAAREFSPAADRIRAGIGGVFRLVPGVDGVVEPAAPLEV